MDLEARARTRTLYLPFGSIPMFPKCLAEGLFSLRAAAAAAEASTLGGDASSSGSSGNGGDGGECAPKCCALSIGATLNEDGSLADFEVTPSYVRVRHRLTYDEADDDIALGPMARLPQLQQLYEAARLRWG